MLKGFYYLLIWPYFEAFSGLFEDFGKWLEGRMQRWRTEGFTLVEMSMVLVIIGLLVGSVLVGQIMIKQAETQAQITQIQKYDSAVNTFKNKYNGIPGDLDVVDATNFGFAVPPGCSGQKGGRDGNGLIDGGSAALDAFMGENALFWADLGTANLVDEGGSLNGATVWPGLCIASYTTTTLVGYLPPGKIGYNTWVHVYETGGYNWYLLAQIAPFSSTTSVVIATPTIPVSQAYNIDKKIDDGIPTTGIVRAVYINGSQTSTTQAPNGNPDTSSTCYNNSTNTYSMNVSNGSNPNCALSFKMQGAAR